MNLDGTKHRGHLPASAQTPSLQSLCISGSFATQRQRKDEGLARCRGSAVTPAGGLPISWDAADQRTPEKSRTPWTQSFPQPGRSTKLQWFEKLIKQGRKGPQGSLAPWQAMAKFLPVSLETGAHHRRSLPHLAQDFQLISSEELKSTKKF